MCGIVASFDKERLIALFKANESRGGFSWSIATIDPVMLTIVIRRFQGKVDYKFLEALPEGYFYAGHTQAPTNGLNNTSGIHPAESDGYYLFHNGILRSEYLSRLKQDLSLETNWDTEVLLNKTIRSSKFRASELTDVEGSFACLLLYGGNMPRLFRNATSPLFMNSELDISSVDIRGNDAFEPFAAIQEGQVLSLNLFDKKAMITDTFTNIDTPFFFAGD